MTPHPLNCSPPAAPRSRIPLHAIASFFCPLPTLALYLCLLLGNAHFCCAWQFNAVALAARGAALVGILLAIPTCRARYFAPGLASLLLNALALCLAPTTAIASTGLPP